MTNVPFAIGEEFSSKWAFAPYIERGLTNFIRLDVCNVGGLTEARKVAGWAETHYIDVMPHNPLGPISTAACVHLAASISNFASLEYSSMHDVDRARDLFPEALQFEGTSFPLPPSRGSASRSMPRQRRILRSNSGRLPVCSARTGATPTGRYR